eukprot:766655-Hanusia_phi.AAC.5
MKGLDYNVITHCLYVDKFCGSFTIRHFSVSRLPCFRFASRRQIPSFTATDPFSSSFYLHAFLSLLCIGFVSAHPSSTIPCSTATTAPPPSRHSLHLAFENRTRLSIFQSIAFAYNFVKGSFGSQSQQPPFAATLPQEAHPTPFNPRLSPSVLGYSNGVPEPF